MAWCSPEPKGANGYMNGFGNEFESEAQGYEGAIPRDSINPQRCKYDLFAEQLSGSAFTAPRCSNRRTWLYRIKPSVGHQPFKRFDSHQLDYASGQVEPNQTRWTPFVSERTKPCDFVEGLNLLAFSDQSCHSAISIFIYMANQNMHNKSFSNSDGDLLIVPQNLPLLIRTEFGTMDVKPNEVAVVQQGMRFRVDLPSDSTEIARGYVLEIRGNHFELPNLGPIGANGLANPRDFQVPTAAVDLDSPTELHKIVLKFQNELFEAVQRGSPYNVAAWFGNYVPYKYDLSKFVTINSVSVDHPDPSIFTVLTCPLTGKPGTALADFVIFPPRWECAQNTFRPPYYHRNCMTEFMGLIKGRYQAKSKAFAPGGASLHQAMMPHGPDRECFETASKQDTSAPKRVADNTMSFMFETSLGLKLTRWARDCNVDRDYHTCWQGLG